MALKLKNNAVSRLASGITTSSTSITVTSGEGGRFPTLGASDYFYAFLVDAAKNTECVKVTARTSDTFTVVRAQQGTAARAYITGDAFELRLSAQDVEDIIATKLPTAANPADDDKFLRANAGVAAWQSLRARDAPWIMARHCYLEYTSTAFLTLRRQDGKHLTVIDADDTLELLTVPELGVLFDNTGLAANTLYYVYAYNNAGALACEFSTTGYITHSNRGFKVKSSDATRRLVGMARTVAGGSFSSALVVSYFNRVLRTNSITFTADQTTASTSSFVELGTGLRRSFLTWGDTDILFGVTGTVSNDTLNELLHTAVAIDAASTIRVGTSLKQAVAGVQCNIAFSGRSRETEGYHEAMIAGRVSAGTGTWEGGNTVVERDVSLSVTISG
jgi:hypothetical protein